MHHRFRSSLPVMLVAVLTPALAAQQQSVPASPLPTVALRAVAAGLRAAPIHVDGRLDDAAWQTVQPATDFYQWQPNEGEPATQRTEVRFLVDDDAFYIGARMFDELGAAGVRSQLIRRDEFPAGSDWIEIRLDAFHDHLGQMVFATTPSGMKGDAYGPGGSNTDYSWDPVYELATGVDSLGWVAEYRIPFSQLRFPRDSVQTWGVQITRMVMRLNEHSIWAYWRRNESGGPSRYNHIEDLRITARPGRAEVMPYVVGRSTNVRGDDADPFYDAHATDARFGLDLNYLVTSNLTLTATVNPDFGQVEVDPAVVNLSAFETFFTERRPFFVEGAGLFSFGGISCYSCSNVYNPSFFYSRRIGRQPQGATLAFGQGQYADIPENTAIVGAAKLTGRLGGGFSLAVSDAVTARERATVQVDPTTRREVEVEPFTNYFVARMARDFARGNGQVRLLASSVVRDLGDSALANLMPRHAEVLGVEGFRYWNSRTYRVFGRLVASDVSGDSSAILRLQRSSARYFDRPDRQHGGNGLFSDRYDPSLTSLRGWAAYARLSKESGDWLWEAHTNIVSPGLETNDAGFLTRADNAWMGASLLRQFTRPNRFAREMVFLANAEQSLNFDGDLTYRSFMAYTGLTFHNYWNVAFITALRPDVLDDRLARGGPVLGRPGLWVGVLEASTDSRKSVSFSLNEEVVRSDGRWSATSRLNATWRPTPSVTVSAGPSLDVSASRNQWVTRVADPTATLFYGRRYVFADLAYRELGMETRLSVSFTPTLTLDLYAQPLIASGRYTAFKEFDRPRTLDRSVYGRDVGTLGVLPDGRYEVDPDGAGPAAAFRFGNPDFNYRSLRGNAVLRWEFHPGSTLYLVWTQSRESNEAVGNLNLGRDLDGLFSSRPDNIFLVKMSYWLGF